MTGDSGAADELRGVAARRLSEISETGVEYDELSEDLRDQLYQLGYIDE
jgi:phosphatidylserine synthase